jgi:aspartyl-tRNA(Asn)/glutamyl-tRNA(Gln) amidotransferase subunit A
MLMGDFGSKLRSDGAFGEKSEANLLGMSNQPIHTMSIADLQASYTRGTLTPGPVATYFIERIERLNAKLNAFIEIDYDQIARAVLESDRRFSEDAQRPLEGIPIAVTADFAMKGLCHSAGLSVRNDVIAPYDAEAVRRLRDAGAIILGTLNMDEAGLGCDGANPYNGQSVNPHDHANAGGGAAGGAAVAVSAGLCTAALGVDRFGSVRVPSALCGVFGYQPTVNDELSGGIWPAVSDRSMIGVVTRSMDDLSFLSNVLFSPDLSTAMRRSRFMRLAKDGGVECEMHVSLAYAATLSELREPPAEILISHDCRTIADSVYALNAREIAEQMVALGAEKCMSLSAQFEERMEPALSQDEDAFAAHEENVAQLVVSFTEQLGSNGILIIPTTPMSHFLLGQEAPQSTADFAALANAAGVPSVTIPVGRGNAMPPIGVMLIGPHGGDAMVIAQARMLNDALRGYDPPVEF